MATIADIIGKSAKEAIESTVRNANKVVNEVVEEVAEEAGKKGKKKKKKKKRSTNKAMDVNDVDNDSKVIADRQERVRARLNANQARNAERSVNTQDVISLPRDVTLTNQAMDKAVEAGYDPASRQFNTRVSQFENEIRQERVRTAVQQQGGRVHIPESTNDIRLHNELNGIPNTEPQNTMTITGSKDIPKPEGMDDETWNKIKQNSESKVKDVANKQKDKKVEDSRKYFTNENIKKTVGLGVGGAIVFNMFDKGGQMSNAELYGQQQPYGY